MFGLIKNSHIDFMSKRKYAMMFSGILLFISAGSLFVNGLNFGIDFTGGSLVEVGYPDSADLAEVKAALSGKGFDNTTAQHFGTSKEVLIRVAPREGISQNDISQQVINALKEKSPEVDATSK